MGGSHVGADHSGGVVLGQSKFWFPHLENAGGNACLLVGWL